MPASQQSKHKYILKFKCVEFSLRMMLNHNMNRWIRHSSCNRCFLHRTLLAGLLRLHGDTKRAGLTVGNYDAYQVGIYGKKL